MQAEEPSSILIGKGEGPQRLWLPYANRHGLIAGATGTGKTVSLQVLAEGLSSQGVPVFLADVKGDLGGVSQPGDIKPKLQDRAAAVGVTDYAPMSFPTTFWDVFGQQGHPVRTTITDMGPLLLARLLDLNDTQEGVLNAAFKFADDEGLLLLDLDDLRTLLAFMADNAPMETSRKRPWEPSNGNSWSYPSRAARRSSANPPWRSPTSCEPTPTAAGA